MEYNLKFGQIPVEPEFWFIKAPLYHSEDYRFENCISHGFDDYRKNLLAVIFPIITIDVYCPNCERETVFVPAKRTNDWFHEGSESIKYGVSHAHFQCSRGECRSDLFFVFLFGKGVLTKIGQFPSIADLIKPELQKYRKV